MSDQNRNSLYENSEYPPRSQRSRTPEGQRKERRSRKGRRKDRMSTVWKVLGTLLLVGICTEAIMCCFAAVYIKTVIMPQVDLSLDDFQLGENSIMLYQDKETGEYKELVTLLNTTSSIWVDYEDMPENLINAAIAIEDKRFWTHPGVDWKRTTKAVLDMFTGGDISGGSTITQQLIKNLTGYNETTVKRKIIEIFRALRFTQNNSKEDTITYYLNVIPLGSGCEGVGSAAYTYFGKSVSELSLAECASLISITNNPSKYGPYSQAEVVNSEGEVWTARQWNKWRQENVLFEMLDQGMITQEEYDQAVAEELVFVRGENEEAPAQIYSWYEETVISDVKADLMEEYKISEKRAEQLLASGGLRIYTCVDPEIQAIAEEIYTNRENLNYTSASDTPMQSSITILDNLTGNVVAIVGQFGEKTGNLWTNYANTAKRQPGSSIKPLSVYAPALEMGAISPITIIDDYPYNDSNGSGWPLNSGNARYKGLTTVRQGLTNSVNTIAVRILADLVTPQQSFNFVEQKFKIDLVEALEVGDQIKSDIDVAPLAMGGLTKGVSSRDMAEAYATFPNGGVYTESRTYTKVEDSEGNIILENELTQEPVIKDTTAYYINSMLTNVVTSGTAAGYGISGMTAAGKTGTTSENYDRWFVGYTPYYTAAVWTGYPQNEKMRTSGNPALKLWHQVMGEIHDGLENKKFTVPSGLKSVEFCLDSGLLPNEYCAMDPRGSRVSSDYVFQGDVPTERCTIHTAESVVRMCKDCPILDGDGKETGLYHIAGPYCPEESIVEMCLPDYERTKIGTATAQDEMYRKSVVESYGTCTVHTEAPVVEPEPEEPENPWDPWNPWDPGEEEGGSSSSSGSSSNGSSSGSQGESSGEGSEQPSQDIPR
ncbi:transglycosylase domain-containing protein [Flavonifractor sp. An100]|uniref:transglycosylase domain-containing protein n=1 Tax=Flavonifractor sp. An100 TaxID=1965538 RepID=UPI0011798C64|nr:transglycosylase domain-containing protein [Flavonifractor sp. An100]